MSLVDFGCPGWIAFFTLIAMILGVCGPPVIDYMRRHARGARP